MNVLPRKLLEFYVKFRTSYWYLGFFAIWIGLWIFLNKSGIASFDNGELTYLNLILSVLAELQSIMLLIYTMRITERNDRADQKERDNVAIILKKLEHIHGEVTEIGEELDDDGKVESASGDTARPVVVHYPSHLGVAPSQI